MPQTTLVVTFLYTGLLLAVALPPVVAIDEPSWRAVYLLFAVPTLTVAHALCTYLLYYRPLRWAAYEAERNLVLQAACTKAELDERPLIPPLVDVDETTHNPSFGALASTSSGPGTGAVQASFAAAEEPLGSNPSFARGGLSALGHTSVGHDVRRSASPPGQGSATAAVASSSRVLGSGGAEYAREVLLEVASRRKQRHSGIDRHIGQLGRRAGAGVNLAEAVEAQLWPHADVETEGSGRANPQPPTGQREPLTGSSTPRTSVPVPPTALPDIAFVASQFAALFERHRRWEKRVSVKHDGRTAVYAPTSPGLSPPIRSGGAPSVAVPSLQL